MAPRKKADGLITENRSIPVVAESCAPLRAQLLEMAEPSYRDFISPLMPGVKHVIGIRIPLLRRMAREIVRGEWREYLRKAEDFYFEERLLQGLVIGYAKCSVEEKLSLTAQFVPKIDNWAVCDCFCRKLSKRERDPVWEFIQPYFLSKRAYDLRFAVVTALGNFVDKEHLAQLFDRFNAIHHEDYYVRMGVAWAVSVCFVKFPEQTLAYLRCAQLGDWTFNKSIQKITESYRVSADDKTIVRTMRRR